MLVDALALAVVLGARAIDDGAGSRSRSPPGSRSRALQWLPALARRRASGCDGRRAAARAARRARRAGQLRLARSRARDRRDRRHARVAAEPLRRRRRCSRSRPLGAARRIATRASARRSLALVVGRGGWPAWLGAPELHLAVLAVVARRHRRDGPRRAVRRRATRALRRARGRRRRDVHRARRDRRATGRVTRRRRIERALARRRARRWRASSPPWCSRGALAGRVAHAGAARAARSRPASARSASIAPTAERSVVEDDRRGSRRSAPRDGAGARVSPELDAGPAGRAAPTAIATLAGSVGVALGRRRCAQTDDPARPPLTDRDVARRGARGRRAARALRHRVRDLAGAAWSRAQLDDARPARRAGRSSSSLPRRPPRSSLDWHWQHEPPRRRSRRCSRRRRASALASSIVL